MATPALALGQFIPSPPVSGFHVGPAFFHFYGLLYVIGIALAIYITRRRWAAVGGNPSLVIDVATWGVPAGIVGARIYFDVTTPFDIVPKTWWGPFAVWNGGLSVWGGIAAGALVGAWRVRRSGASVGLFADATAPALLVAQAIGRIGNYFDQQLFGKPSTLPWALEVSRAARLSAGIPASDLRFSTFQPSFLYELIFDLALAAFLVWLGHHAAIKPPGLFALYVAGYSGYRIFEETIRIDSSAHFLGLRLNFFVAIAMTLVGITWFILSQRERRVRVKGAAGLAIGGLIALAAAGCGQQGHPAAAAAHGAGTARAAHQVAARHRPAARALALRARSGAALRARSGAALRARSGAARADSRQARAGGSAAT
jgi:prolipoprotein diacylglyceryl transferase